MVKVAKPRAGVAAAPVEDDDEQQHTPQNSESDEEENEENEEESDIIEQQLQRRSNLCQRDIHCVKEAGHKGACKIVKRKQPTPGYKSILKDAKARLQKRKAGGCTSPTSKRVKDGEHLTPLSVVVGSVVAEFFEQQDKTSLRDTIMTSISEHMSVDEDTFDEAFEAVYQATPATSDDPASVRALVTALLQRLLNESAK